MFLLEVRMNIRISRHWIVNVYLKFPVENVENEFAHDMFGIVEDLLHDRRVSLAQGHNVNKHITAGESALKTLMNYLFIR